MESGISIKRPTYVPTKDDKKVGIVTYIPWKIQDYICKSFATLLSGLCWICKSPSQEEPKLQQ